MGSSRRPSSLSLRKSRRSLSKRGPRTSLLRRSTSRRRNSSVRALSAIEDNAVLDVYSQCIHAFPRAQVDLIAKRIGVRTAASMNKEAVCSAVVRALYSRHAETLLQNGWSHVRTLHRQLCGHDAESRPSPTAEHEVERFVVACLQLSSSVNVNRLAHKLGVKHPGAGRDREQVIRQLAELIRDDYAAKVAASSATSNGLILPTLFA
jgi:hypothetical protein